MQRIKNTESVLFGILFLFLIQVLSDFIQSIYSFGLLVTAFTVEIASIVLLFTPLVLLFFRKPPSRLILLILAFLALLARLVEPMLNPGGRLVACGLSVGAFMLLFPLLLHGRQSIRGFDLAGGLALGIMASILFRTAGSGLDISEQGIFQLISWLLGLLAAYLFWLRDWSTPAGEDRIPVSPSGGRITGLSIGLAAVILMIYFAFANPMVIARWTGSAYLLVLIALLAALLCFGYFFTVERFVLALSRPLVLAWNCLFVLSLVLTILPHQVSLPPIVDLYPLEALPAPWWSVIPLLLMLLSSPVLFVDFIFFARQLVWRKPSLRQLGGSFALAALFFLVMVFFHVFTTIYDYAPVVGPLFRDRFWLVYLLAGLGLILPLLPLDEQAFAPHPTGGSTKPIVMSSLAILALLAVWLTAAKPVGPRDTSSIKIMTYNIQQGFDKAGNQGLQGQLAVVRAVDPVILGLEESDTARIANGNADAVRFFSDHLDMYSYYGPVTTTGTFGIALLSKYPIKNPGTFYMYSEGEQTATIHAEITIRATTYNVFVTHLGNGGPMIQLQNIMTRLQKLDHVIIMGDFNFRPPTDQYALITQSLDDSWLLKWPAGKEIPGYLPEKRIDHIFVSPGTQVLQSEYVVDPASDHPYMWTTIAP